MQAIIFAAGMGTRLKPITDNIPKALLPLAGKTLLEWQIERLKEAGIERIIVNVHHKAEMIKTYLYENRMRFGNILISDETEHLLNTGGAIKHAMPLIDSQKPLLALNVDILSNINLRTVCNSKLDDALLVVSQRDTARYLLFDNNMIMRGWTNIKTAQVRPQNLNIEDLKKYAFSGMQLLAPQTLELFNHEEQDEFSMIDFYIKHCTDHKFNAFVPNDYKMMDVGKIEQLQQAELYARELAK